MNALRTTRDVYTQIYFNPANKVHKASHRLKTVHGWTQLHRLGVGVWMLRVLELANRTEAFNLSEVS